MLAQEPAFRPGYGKRRGAAGAGLQQEPWLKDPEGRSKEVNLPGNQWDQINSLNLSADRKGILFCSTTRPACQD
jgi:hypothetical protein